MPATDLSSTMMTEIKEAVMSTSGKILRLSQGNRLGDVAAVRELYEVLRTAIKRVGNLLNEGTPTHRLPPEILTRILYLAVDHGSGEHAKQIIPLTHVCRYWRTLILSYPRMWSTLCLKPGNPSITPEWLARSQKLPLTVIAEFADAYGHPPCRYRDLVTATLTSTDELEVCPRHKAILSLDQLLPHRSRIRDLDILIRFSDPDWEENDRTGEPPLLYHQFFKQTLPNLHSLDFRATHIEQKYSIPVRALLFGGRLPRLKELKYLGVNGGLTKTAKDLVSCEIGVWSESAGPAMIGPEELLELISNNKTAKSLTIGECEFFFDSGDWAPTNTPMLDLKYLEIRCNADYDFEKIAKCIHVPQFKNINTAHLSLSDSSLRMVATDGTGHTFVSSQCIYGRMNFRPLRHLGADITTLRLDQGITVQKLDEEPALDEYLLSLDAVQVLEFDRTVDSAKNILSEVLSIDGVFPGLKVIRVGISRGDCEGVLWLLATVLRQRMEEGNPLTTVEPFLAEGLGKCAGSEDGLGQELRAEWEKRYEAEGLQNFLS